MFLEVLKKLQAKKLHRFGEYATFQFFRNI